MESSEIQMTTTVSKAVIALACMVVLAGCAGRNANPVQAIQPNDDTLTCEQVLTSMKLNTTELKGLVKESSSNRGKNVAAGVIGAVVFFPALFFMDTKNAADDEARALVRRNQVLFQRHNLMKCEPVLEDKNTEDYVIHWEQMSSESSSAANTNSPFGPK